MTDNVAMSFRKSRAAAVPAPQPARSGPSTVLLGLAAAAIGFGAMAWLKPGMIKGLVPERAATWFGLATTRPPVAGAPRFIAPVAGVRETGTTTTGLGLSGTQALALSYVATGPVILRTAESYVEVSGGRLLPPPMGRARSQGAVLDHASRLGNELRTLAYTPCDKHLRFLAAANINLFIAGFQSPRTAIQTSAAPNTAFWSQPEANAVRRVARELAAKGALGPADFGLDTSPEIKGLFLNAPLGQPACG